MKIYVLTEEENECPIGPDGDESFIEWEEIRGVTRHLEKAQEWQNKSGFNNFKTFELD